MICATPKEGFRYMQRITDSHDADVRWVIKENLKKNRLIKNFPNEVAAIKKLPIMKEVFGWIWDCFILFNDSNNQLSLSFGIWCFSKSINTDKFTSLNNSSTPPQWRVTAKPQKIVPLPRKTRTERRLVWMEGTIARALTRRGRENTSLGCAQQPTVGNHKADMVLNMLLSLW